MKKYIMQKYITAFRFLLAKTLFSKGENKIFYGRKQYFLKANTMFSAIENKEKNVIYKTHYQ
jgi:hypothetical protein